MKYNNRLLTPAAALLLWAISFPAFQNAVLADDDDDDGGVSSRFVTHEGEPAIRLEQEMRDKTAIQTTVLEKRSVLHEVRAVGEVVDITPLLELQSRYLDIRSEKERIHAALEVAAETVDRLSTLRSMDGNISTRELNAAKLNYRQETIRLDALNRQLENTANIIRQKWGGVLAGWAREPESEQLLPLADMEEALVLVQSSVPAESVYINSIDERESARRGRYVSPAPRALANRSGDTYYYRTDREGLRSGMRLYVWIPDPEQEISGYILPRDAIVWFNGKPWYYIRRSGDLFVKQPVDDHVVTGGGWLLPDTDLSGVEIVTEGSQLLLSEEYRWQIPDEDDDP